MGIYREQDTILHGLAHLSTIESQLPGHPGGTQNAKMRTLCLLLLNFSV